MTRYTLILKKAFLPLAVQDCDVNLAVQDSEVWTMFANPKQYILMTDKQLYSQQV